MRKYCATLLMIIVAVSFSGCATYLPHGGIFTEVTAPISVTESDFSHTKVGTAMATSVLGLVATGDASIRAAANNGGIKKIKHVEYSVKNILGVIGEYTTTVYGD